MSFYHPWFPILSSSFFVRLEFLSVYLFFLILYIKAFHKLNSKYINIILEYTPAGMTGHEWEYYKKNILTFSMTAILRWISGNKNTYLSAWCDQTHLLERYCSIPYRGKIGRDTLLSIMQQRIEIRYNKMFSDQLVNCFYMKGEDYINDTDNHSKVFKY